MMGWYNDGSWGWGGWITMALAMAVFWGLLIFAVVAIFRSSARDEPVTGSERRGPREILDERFARGEIDEDEYRARMDVLRGVGHDVKPGAR